MYTPEKKHHRTGAIEDVSGLGRVEKKDTGVRCVVCMVYVFVSIRRVCSVCDLVGGCCGSEEKEKISPSWVRTSDLAVNSHTLYQLSYRRSVSSWITHKKQIPFNTRTNIIRYQKHTNINNITYTPYTLASNK